MKDKVLEAIRSLPDAQREVTTLFYINGYSHNDIADFLDVPVGTVKTRLHSSRKRLKERMMTMVEKILKEHALPEDFRIVVGDACRTRTTSPSLTWFRDRWVLVWQDGEPGEPYDGPFWFLLSESQDAKQWSEPRRLDLDPQWQHAPQLCVVQDEILLHTHNHHHGVRIARSRDLQEWSRGPAYPLGDIGRSGIFARAGEVHIAYPRWCSVNRIGDSVDVISSSDLLSWRWLASPRTPRGTGITDATGLATAERVYVMWREHDYTNEPCHDVHVCWSKDGGTTWCDPVKVPSLSTKKGSLMMAVAASSDGSLAIAQDARDESGVSQVEVAISRDRGRTWSDRATYSTGSPVDPAAAFAPDGTPLLATSSRRDARTSAWVVHSHVHPR